MPEFAKELALNDFVDWNLECRLYISNKDVNWQIVYKFTFKFLFQISLYPIIFPYKILPIQLKFVIFFFFKKAPQQILLYDFVHLNLFYSECNRFM